MDCAREHSDAKVRQNLEMLLKTSETGDTIITTEVSRLSRHIVYMYLKMVG